MILTSALFTHLSAFNSFFFFFGLGGWGGVCGEEGVCMLL